MSSSSGSAVLMQSGISSQISREKRGVDQGRSKLFKSAGDGCGLFVNNKNDQYNDRRVQKV